jgi:hypothetical protein
VFSNGFLGLSKPVVMWANTVVDEGCGTALGGPGESCAGKDAGCATLPLGADFIFQKLLHVGAYPLLPVDGSERGRSQGTRPAGRYLACTTLDQEIPIVDVSRALERVLIEPTLSAASRRRTTWGSR